MKKPIISAEARTDLDEIWLYIAQDSVRAADRVVSEIYDAIYDLGANPTKGHVREDLTDLPLRFWRVRSYLIVYRPDTDPLEVARVLSGYRDISALLS